MKRSFRVVILLLALAVLAGYLLSKASWVGRAGINLFYTEYKFLKVWWQAGAVVFAAWMLLFFLQGRAQQKLSSAASKRVQIAALAFAVVGLYFTFQDFRHNTAHRWLGERFHLGGYLFWIGWMIVSVFYLTQKKALPPANALANNREGINA